MKKSNVKRSNQPKREESLASRIDVDMTSTDSCKNTMEAVKKIHRPGIFKVLDIITSSRG
jgi:hypothetical protein